MADKQTPNVNFMLDFLLPHYEDQAKQDQRNYYSSNKYNDYVKYVETGIKDLKNLDYVEYANNDTKSSGIFNENGKLDRTDIANLRKDLRETQSVIWSAVISFEEKFGKKWCSNYEQAQYILQSELPKFFKNAGLKPENMEWFAGLHENTDNRHIHLIFFEKEPIRNVKGKKKFSIGKLPLNAMEKFKAEIELYYQKSKYRRNSTFSSHLPKGMELVSYRTNNEPTGCADIFFQSPNTYLCNIYVYNQNRGIGIGTVLDKLIKYVSKDHSQKIVGAYMPYNSTTDFVDVDTTKKDVDQLARVFYYNNGYSIINHEDFLNDGKNFLSITEEDFYCKDIAQDYIADDIVYCNFANEVPLLPFTKLDRLYIHNNSQDIVANL